MLNKLRKLQRHKRDTNKPPQFWGDDYGIKEWSLMATLGMYFNISMYTLIEYGFAPAISIEAIPIFIGGSLLSTLIFLTFSMALFSVFLIPYHERFSRSFGLSDDYKLAYCIIVLALSLLGVLSYYLISIFEKWYLILYFFLGFLLVVALSWVGELKHISKKSSLTLTIFLYMLCIWLTTIVGSTFDKSLSMVHMGLKTIEAGGNIPVCIETRTKNVCGELILYDGNKAWLTDNTNKVTVYNAISLTRRPADEQIAEK